MSGMRLLLDTPVLVDLVDESTQAQDIAKEVVSLSQRLGIQVLVGEHVLDEWQRLWAGARDEYPERLDGRTTIQGFARLISSRYSNPFVKQFVRYRSDGNVLRWEQFRIQRSSIRVLLESLGVSIISNTFVGNKDREVATRMIDELLRLSADPNTPGSRTRSTAQTDATSALMVGRWRDQVPMVPCSAFLLSPEHLTEVAYRSVFELDKVSLVVRPSAWLVFVASLVADDPGRQAEIAELVGNAVFRDSFFGLATAYTLDNAVKLADYLQEENMLSLEDSRELARISVSDFLGGAAQPDDEEVIRAVAMEAIRQRSARRDARAQRVIDQANAEVTEKRDEADALRRQLGDVEGDLERVKSERERDKRKGHARVAMLVGVFLLAIAGISGDFSSRTFGLFGVLWAMFEYLALQYLRRDKIGLSEGSWAVGLAILAALLIKFV